MKMANGEALVADQLSGAYDELGAIFHKISLYPFGVMLSSLGMSHSTFLHEKGGLSKGRVHQGNLDKLRPNTQKKLVESLSSFAVDEGLKKGYTEDEVHERLESMPRCSNGDRADFAGMLHSLQSPERMLPLSIAVALAIDELFLVLQRAHQSGDLEAFKCAVLEFARSQKWHELPEVCGNTFDGFVRKWNEIKNWEQAKELADKFFMEVFASFHCALDVEWANQYFAGFCDRPVLPLIAPKPTPKALTGEKLKAKDGLLHRPVRRLLEFSAAVIYRNYKKEWPASRPTVKQLAEWMNFDEDQVCNYIDGSSALTSAKFLEHWEQMCRWISGEDDEQCLAHPSVMCVFALGWQAGWIKRTKTKKVISFVFLDKDWDYHWVMYRARWAGQLQVAERTLEWPDWLVS